MAELRNAPVLVTGAGGFIGSHMVEALVNAGARVRALLRYNSRNDRGSLHGLPPSIQSQIEVFVGDLKDAQAVRNAVRGCDIVFHLGALVAIPYSYINPTDFVQTNVMGTAHVLNACRDEGVSRLVHTSTSEVYGTAQYAPIDEAHPLQGQSPYSASKIGADMLVQAYTRAFDLPTITVRPFNTYGPRQSARAIIPTIITQALTQQVVFLGALHPTRDLTYVEDTVRGFLLAATAEGVHSEIINLGQGKEISIGDLAMRVLKLLGSAANIQHDARRVRPVASEVERLICDASKAQRLLGWQPTISLDEGLHRCIEYVRSHLDRYRPREYNV